MCYFINMISNVKSFWSKIESSKLQKINEVSFDIIDDIRDIFIEMSKGIVSDEDICLIEKKYKNLLK